MHSEKIYPIISDQLPDYVQEEYDTFVKFIDYYYEYLDKEYQIKGEEVETIQADDTFGPIQFGKNPIDSITATDTLESIVGYTRVFDDQQSVADVSTLETTKVFTEPLTAVETFSTVSNFNRDFNEGQPVPDTGYIVLLDYDYVDITYFSEDYVGDVRVF